MMRRVLAALLLLVVAFSTTADARLVVNQLTGFNPAAAGCSVVEADITSGATVTASTTSAGSPSDIRDDNTGTDWIADEGGGAYVTVDLGLGNDADVRTVRIFPANNGGNMRIQGFTFRASTDNFSSSNVLIGSDTHTNTDQWESFSFSNGTTYRYYRIIIDTTYGGSPGLGEIEFYECT